MRPRPGGSIGTVCGPRGATKADLIAYAKTAAAKAKLDTQRLAALEGALKTRRRRDNTRFGATWNIMQTRAEAAAKAVAKVWSKDESLKARPFEHPIYWGAFVYTGL